MPIVLCFLAGLFGVWLINAIPWFWIFVILMAMGWWQKGAPRKNRRSHRR